MGEFSNQKWISSVAPLIIEGTINGMLNRESFFDVMKNSESVFKHRQGGDGIATSTVPLLFGSADLILPTKFLGKWVTIRIFRNSTNRLFFDGFLHFSGFALRNVFSSSCSLVELGNGQVSKLILNFGFPSESHLVDSHGDLLVFLKFSRKVEVIEHVHFLGESEITVRFLKLISFLLTDVFENLFEFE